MPLYYVNSTFHSGPSENRGPARYLPTRKAVLINDYLLQIILKVIVLDQLDQYSPWINLDF